MWCIAWWFKNYGNIDFTEDNLLNKTRSWVEGYEVLSKQNRETEKLINLQENTILNLNFKKNIRVQSTCTSWRCHMCRLIENRDLVMAYIIHIHPIKDCLHHVDDRSIVIKSVTRGFHSFSVR